MNSLENIPEQKEKRKIRNLRIIDLEKHNKIKRFIEERLPRKEIAERIKVPYSTLESHLLNHPELPALADEREGIRDFDRYDSYKFLMEKGLKQIDIARELKITRQAVNDYIKKHPELKELYWKIRRRKR